MGESFAIFQDGSGGVRLRSVKAPYSPMDLGVDRKFVTFDSTWLNSFRVRASGVVPEAGLPSTSQTVGSATRETKTLAIAGSGPDRPTLAWLRNDGGSLSDGITYARGYGTCGVSMTDSEIRLSPAGATKAGMTYVYYVFSTNPLAPEGAGGGGGLIGNHPLYGPGLYIARPGVNPLTAGLDDMMLTTQRNHFQIQQTGLTGAATHSLSGDPFPMMATSVLRQGFLVHLGRSYPDYPPVIAFPTDGFNTGGAVADRHGCSIFWIDASTLMILSSFGSSSPIRWAICSNTADYVVGTGAQVIRVAMVAGHGLYVTKKGISYPSAGAGDFLFRSDRQTPQFLGFADIPTGAPTGLTPYNLPGPYPSSGVPFTFFFSYWNNVTGWWCGCGMMTTQDFITGSGASAAYYGPAFTAIAVSSTQYKWYNNASLSGGYVGKVATMNVSDFT